MTGTLTPLVKFGEWTPDKPDLGNTGAVVCSGVVPVGEDYTPVRGIQASTDALPDVCYGFYSCVGGDGVTHTFAGTLTGMYKRTGSTWTDVSKSGGYSTTDEGRWRFVKFGNLVIASNYVDTIQAYDITSSTNFADLSGSAPKAKYLAIVNDFLLAGYTNDSIDGVRANRVRWSALGNATDFNISASTQSDLQDIADGGNVVGVTGTQNSAVVIQENSIRTMEYVGSPIVFNIYVSEESRGCKIDGSIVSYSDAVFYLGEDGFYAYSGGISKPIGHDKIDQWFRSHADLNNTHRIWSAINPRNKIVVWAFPSVESDGTPDTMLFYSWTANRWSYAKLDVECLARLFTETVNLDDLTTTFLEDLDVSIDSSQFVGGRVALAAMTNEHKLGYFDGDIIDAEIQTAEARLNPAGRALVAGVLPVVDNSGVQVQLSHRNLQSETQSTTSLRGINAVTGECDFLTDARYFSAVVKLTGNWTRAQGVQIRYKPTGYR